MDVQNNLTREELLDRFPEINEITDDFLREETINVFLYHCPDYFWRAPASSSGKYHQVDHRGEHGLWLHTKRAFTEFEALGRSYHYQDRLSSWEMDCGRSAILLHDIFKYSYPKRRHTIVDHDVVAANFLRDNSDLPEEVIGCIESHNGPEDWGGGRAPRNDLEDVHHMADMVASREENHNIAVQNPSDELVKSFDDIRRR